MLLVDDQLKALDPGWKSLGRLVQEYIETSQEAQDTRERLRAQEELEQARALAHAESQRAQAERAAKNRLRMLVAALALLVVLGGVLAGVAMDRAAAAEENRLEAEEQAGLARKSQKEAESAREKARQALAGQLIYRACDQVQENAALSLRLGALAGQILTDQEPGAQAAQPNGGDPLRQLYWLLQRTDSVPWQASDAQILDVAFDSESRRLLSADAEGEIRAWSLDALDWDKLDQPSPISDTLYSLAGNPGGLIFAAFDRQGTEVAFQDEDLNVGVLKLEDGEPQFLAIGDAQSHFWHLTFSPDGTLLVAGNEEGEIEVWQVQDTPFRREDLSPLTLQDEDVNDDDRVLALAISEDNRWLAAGNGDHIVYLWRLDSRSPENPYEVPGFDQGVEGLVFSGNNSILVAGGSQGTPWKLEIPLLPATLASQEPDEQETVDLSAEVPYLTALTAIRARILSLDVDGAGQWLTAGGDDGAVWLWSLTDPELALRPQAIRGHGEAVTKVRLSPDGKWLVTGDNQGWLRLWETARLPTRDNVEGEIPYTARQLAQRACRAATGAPLSDEQEREELTEILQSVDSPFICGPIARK